MTAPRGTDAEKGPAPTTVLPGGADPAKATPGTTTPGTTTPGRGTPGTATPGTATPGTATPRPSAPGGARPGASPRPAPREGRAPTAGRAPVGRTRRARLALKRIDPWSVFLFSLVASVFVGIAVVVAAAVLYAVVGSLGITESLNQLFAEVTGGSAATEPLLTAGRIVGGAAVLAAVNVVFLTLLATLSALLYNLCASFTGGLELTLGERD